MVKLMLIKTEKGIKHEGDVICIRDSSHIFDPNELDLFEQIEIDTIEIDGKTVDATVENVKAMKKAALPEVKKVFESDGKYYEVESAVLTTQAIKLVWNNGGQWQEIKQRPHSAVRWNKSTKNFDENISRELSNLTDIITIESAVEK